MHKKVLPLAALLLAAAIPAIGALGGPFFYADDGTMIVKNPYVLGAKPLAAAFTHQYFNHYAPLHIVLLKLEFALFGSSPLGYRLISILLHFAAAAACWKLLAALTKRPRLALGVAALWAMHPLQSESVAWVVEQKTLWCGLFVFLAMALYANRNRPLWLRIGGALLLMILGGLGKSSAIVLAPLLLLYEALLNDDRDGRPLPRALRLLPFFACTAVFAWLGMWAHALMDSFAAGKWNKLDMLRNMPGALLIYLRTAFLPWQASYFHELDRVISFGNTAFWGSLLLLLAIACTALALARPGQRRLIAFCALAWIAGIGPMLNFSPWTFPAYDRFQYMGLPFLLLGAALALENPLERGAVLLRARYAAQDSPLAPRVKMIGWTAALAVAGLFGLSRGMLFSSEAAVARDAMEKAPRNAYSYAAFAHSLYPEYVRAGGEGRREDQARIAAAIGAAADAARRCWNFRDFYPVPVSLLAMSGEVAREAGQLELSASLLQSAFDDPAWASRYRVPSDAARRSLARVKLQLAEKLLASRMDVARAPAAIGRVLELIAASRTLLAPPLPESFLLEAQAHHGRARLAALQKDSAAAASELETARAALRHIPASSPCAEQADAFMKKLNAPDALDK